MKKTGLGVGKRQITGTGFLKFEELSKFDFLGSYFKRFSNYAHQIRQKKNPGIFSGIFLCIVSYLFLFWI
jgi:hypothetical protein